MLLSELITETYVQTLRPDLVAETTAAVKSATLLAHNSDFYARDLYENGVVFDESLFIQSLSVGVIPNYRKINYIRLYDAVGQSPGPMLEILTPDQIFDAYGVDKVNIAYEAGTQIEIRGGVPFQHILVGAYVTPDITNLGYNSWVADSYPYAIIYSAARIVLYASGNLELGNKMRELAAEQLQEMQFSSIALRGE